MVALSLFFLFGTVGLSVDLGYGYLMRQQAQTAADAAASAAAVYAANNSDTCASGGLSCPVTYNCANPPVSPPTNSLQAGCLYAKQNGFVNDGTNQTVSLTENNTTLSGNTPAMWIKANVTQKLHNTFLFMAGTTATAAAESVGGVTTTPPGNCIYALGTSGTVYDQEGTPSVTATCGVYANADMTVKGAATITASTVQYYGSYTKTGSGTVSPAPTKVTSLVADPLSGIKPPTFTNHCDYTNFTTSSGGTLSQGTYCGGITVTGSTTLMFNPGIYILNGGGLTLAGSGGITGSGVMFFLTAQYGQTAGPVSITGSGAITLTAASSGSYKGILFYQDPLHSYSSANTVAGSAAGSTGTFYFPTTELDYAGSSSQTYEALVASTIKIVGTANLKNDLTGQYTGLVTSKVSLIQ